MKSYNILIVEDEVLIGWAVANALQKVGHNVTLVTSGEQAIDLIKSRNINLVITDFRLPLMNGFDVATTAKSISSDIPVIMMSAYEDSKSMMEKFQDKIDSYLQKPFNIAELLNIVNGLMLTS